jgi:hypothetical protein
MLKVSRLVQSNFQQCIPQIAASKLALLGVWRGGLRDTLPLN